MLQKDIELYYRSLWPTTVDFSILEPFSMMICHITWTMEKTSYKVSDDNVINLCTIKIFKMEQGCRFELVLEVTVKDV